MAYPPGVLQRIVTFGVPFWLAGSDEDLVTRAVFTPTRSMVWGATGAVGIAGARTAKSPAGMQGQLTLAVTDQAGWLDGNGNAISVANGAQTHAYAVKVYIETAGSKVVAELPVKNIVLPAGDLSDVDLDLMLPVSTVGGVTIAIPDLWSQQLTEAQAAAEALNGGAGGFLAGQFPNPGVNTGALDAAVAARVSDRSSDTAASLDEIYATKDDLAGVGGGGGGPSGVQFSQVSPAASWTIPHAFGRRPAVTVYDTNGDQWFPDVRASATSVSLVFANPLAGIAVLT